MLWTFQWPRLLGFKLCECGPPREFCHAILSDVLELIAQYSDLKQHLMVMDVYVDLILQNSMENELDIVLDNTFDHAKRTGINDIELHMCFCLQEYFLFISLGIIKQFKILLQGKFSLMFAKLFMIQLIA